MARGQGADGTDLLEHVVLPVANEADATSSARALAPLRPEAVTVVHVIEKAGGAPDKTPVEQSEAIAERCLEAVREVHPDAELHATYHTDIVEGIFDSAEAVGATAVAFRTRGGGRITRFLSGDLALKLITDPRLPVIVLPDPEGP